MKLVTDIFPKWVTAEVAINEIINRGFRVRGCGHGSAMSITFLPYPLFKMVPPQERDKFATIYVAFITWLDKEAKITESLQPFKHRAMTKYLEQRIYAHVSGHLHKFLLVNGYPELPEMLKGCYGIMPHVYRIPRELKDFVENYSSPPIHFPVPFGGE